MTVRVSLVGAGPGDPGLLTLKAMHRLQNADLIIYDTLANPEHLKHAKKTAKSICVGKRFRHHPFSQKKINRMIISAARKGQNVVRLKGGDPYLFGRGGEEALYLHDHKIPFEVVPGVTSATACAAYAGMPLTHREHNASVTFLTGHRANDKNLDSVRWDKIASLNGTIVVYMGFYNLANIARQLIGHGMRPETKVCVVQWGTLPRQRSCEGTLANIAQKVKKQALEAPAIIIIGGVVGLKSKLDWYEKLPLFGKKVVVTRTRDKMSALTDKLSELGAEVLEFATIETSPVTDFSELDSAIGAVSEYDWLVFTSTYGVDAFFDRLNFLRRDSRALKGLQIACVGSETEKALGSRGLLADLIPKRFETAAIAEEFRARKISIYGKKFLLVRTSIAPRNLENDLRALGANVTRVTGYLTKLPGKYPKAIPEALLRGEVDFVTFTSSSTVDHFVRMLKLKSVKGFSRRTKFASIGPVTSRALRRHGLKAFCQARVYNVDGLIDAIRRAAGKGKK